MAVERATTILQNTFGFSSFRPGQLEATVGSLHVRDVFVRMATGAGKSIPMFLVPLSHSIKAVGIIISPLNSLMDEQVSNFRTYQVKNYTLQCRSLSSTSWVYPHSEHRIPV